jgi:hypothetical protein
VLSISINGINIKLNADGTVEADWRTDEVAAIVCALCGHYGWQRFGPLTAEEVIFPSGEELGPCRGCQMRQPYCG